MKQLLCLMMTVLMLLSAPLAALTEGEDFPDVMLTYEPETEVQQPSRQESADQAPASNEEEEDDNGADTMPLSNTDLLVQEAMANQGLVQESDFANAGMEGLDFADFYFAGVQTMHGIFSSIGLYAELPDYAVAEKAILRLSYTASDLVLSDYSSLTFYMNGTPFYSCRVQALGANMPTVLYINVPVELIKNGYNLLEIGAYVRLTNDAGCTDDYNGANWVKIADTTCLRVGYSVSEDAAQIDMFPYPFVSLMDKSGANCAVAVSDRAANCELDAALTIMADLGATLSMDNDVAFGRISEIDRKNVIYFGLRDNTPSELLALLEAEVPPTGAMIRRAALNGKEYMLVVAREEAALLEAARFLSDDARLDQVHSVEAYVSVGDSQSFIAARSQNTLALEGQYTLKDVLGHGASFSGPFHQSVTLYLPVAEDYALSSESRFSLSFRYSENLDFDRSLITVYWGSDIPLASKKLTREGATGDTLTFAVPADAVGVAGTYMVIAFDLEVKDLDCTPRQLNMPWAYVAEDSTFYLPHGERSVLSLANRPAPFQRGSRMNDVLVVLSDMPTAEELQLAGNAICMLGAGSDPYGTMKVCRSAEFMESDANYNLVIVGMPSSHSMLRQLNDKLHFQFSDDMKSVKSNDKIILDEAYATQVGTMQLIKSPYAEERAMMVLSAPAAEGIRALTDRISEDEKRWALTKESVLVDAHGKANAYQFTQSVAVANEEKPTFTAIIVENREPMLFMLVGLGCMLLVLLGVIIVLFRIRANRKEE